MYSNCLRKAIESYVNLSRQGLNSLDILGRIFDIKLLQRSLFHSNLFLIVLQIHQIMQVE